MKYLVSFVSLVWLNLFFSISPLMSLESNLQEPLLPLSERREMRHSLSGSSETHMSSDDDDTVVDASDEEFAGIPKKFVGVPLIAKFNGSLFPYGTEKISYMAYKARFIQEYLVCLVTDGRGWNVFKRRFFSQQKHYFCYGKKPLKEGGIYYFFYDPELITMYGSFHYLGSDKPSHVPLIIEHLQGFYDKITHIPAKLEFLQLLYWASKSALFYSVPKLPAGAPAGPGIRIRCHLKHRLLRKSLIAFIHAELMLLRGHAAGMQDFSKLLAQVDAAYRREFESFIQDMNCAAGQAEGVLLTTPVDRTLGPSRVVKIVNMKQKELNFFNSRLCMNELCRLTGLGDTSAAVMLLNQIKLGWRANREWWNHAQAVLERCSLISIERGDKEPFLMDVDAFASYIIDGTDDTVDRLYLREKEYLKDSRASYEVECERAARANKQIPRCYTEDYADSPEKKELDAWVKNWNEQTKKIVEEKQRIEKIGKKYGIQNWILPQLNPVLKCGVDLASLPVDEKQKLETLRKHFLQGSKRVKALNAQYMELLTESIAKETDANSKFLARKAAEEEQLKADIARRQAELDARVAERRARSVKGRLVSLTKKTVGGLRRAFSKIRSADPEAVPLCAAAGGVSAGVVDRDAPMAGAGAGGLVPRTMAEEKASVLRHELTSTTVG